MVILCVNIMMQDALIIWLFSNKSTKLFCKALFLRSIKIIYHNWMVFCCFCFFLCFAGNNQNSCSKLRNIFVMWRVTMNKWFNITGLNRLSRCFLRDGVDILSRPLSEICNLSISSGVFPDACKVANLKPIYKKGKKTDLFLYF